MGTHRGRRGWGLVLGVVLVQLFVGCSEDSGRQASTDPAKVSRSTNGMVASAHPLATEAGVAMLEMRGNAVDAAVAVAFALSVLEPSQSGIGGRTQLLIRLPTGEVLGIDGTTATPLALAEERDPPTANSTGYEAVATPGTVAALSDAIARLGKLDLPTVLAPAIALAEEGFPLHAGEASRMAQAAEELARFEGSRLHFLKEDGSSYHTGELFVQPALARTLRAIAVAGPSAFYQGAIAGLVAEDMVANGGFVALEDMETYETQEMMIVRGHYRGYELVGNFLPASGGTVIQTMQMLEHFTFDGRAGSPAWAAIVAQALRIAVEDRQAQMGPLEEMAKVLTSREWAAERAAEIRIPLSMEQTGRAEEAVGLGSADDNTTHLSVADADGMLVALTQSVGPIFGAKVATPGLGFIYASTLARSVPPPHVGLRGPPLNQSPVLVLSGGDPVLVMGAAGGNRILSTIVSVLSRVIDEGLPLSDAISAPRFHPLDLHRIELEESFVARWSEPERESFRELGIQIETMADHGRIHGIQVDPETREYIGVADPRREGSALGPGRGRLPMRD